MIFENVDIFGRRDLSHIQTEFKYLPLNYVGSKKKILSWIWRSIENKKINFNTFLDPFAGSGVVSYFMRLLGKQVYSNDLLISSYYNLLSLVENPNIILTPQEISWLTSHRVKNGGEGFEDIDLQYEDFPHYNEEFFTENYFTQKEAVFLDCFFYKINILQNKFKLDDNQIKYKKAICYSALLAFSNLLPFGSADGSNLFEYRKKQKDKYKNRCKGFYLDSDYNLHLYWLSNYMEKFSNFALLTQGTKQGMAFNQDAFDFLQQDFINDIDVVYFDPPYGGTSSNYVSIYNFLENFIEQKNISKYKINAGQKFSSKNYQEHFSNILDLTQNVKTWIFSYNHKSWQGVDEIVALIKEYKNDVSYVSHTVTLQDRGNMTKKKDVLEHLIFAQ